MDSKSAVGKSCNPILYRDKDRGKRKNRWERREEERERIDEREEKKKEKGSGRHVSPLPNNR